MYILYQATSRQFWAVLFSFGQFQLFDTLPKLYLVSSVPQLGTEYHLKSCTRTTGVITCKPRGGVSSRARRMGCHLLYFSTRTEGSRI